MNHAAEKFVGGRGFKRLCIEFEPSLYAKLKSKASLEQKSLSEVFRELAKVYLKKESV